MAPTNASLAAVPSRSPLSARGLGAFRWMLRGALVASVLVAFPRAAAAQDDGAMPGLTLPAPSSADRVTRPDDEARKAIDRTWLYGDDARVAAPLVTIATSSFSYTNVGGDPTQVSGAGPGAACRTPAGAPQPCYSGFAGNVAQPGGSMLVGAELGLVPRLSVVGNVMVGMGGTGGVPSPDVGGLAGLRLRVFPSSWQNAHLVLGAGYVREAYNAPAYNDDTGRWLAAQPGGVNAAYLQVALSGDIGRLRLAGTIHGQHTFADGRDALDLMVDLGASWRVVGGFRAGLEYVGQDLEESLQPAADGGPRHFIGPIASLQLLHDRLTIVGGPALGLSAVSPDFVARVASSISF